MNGEAVDAEAVLAFGKGDFFTVAKPRTDLGWMGANLRDQSDGRQLVYLD